MSFIKRCKSWIYHYKLRLKNYFYIKPLILWDWYSRRQCTNPPPSIIKHKILLRHGIKFANWIETGTFIGETTKFLSKNYPRVHTIEASNECIQIAKRYVGRKSNITFYQGTSEDLFESILQKQTGCINFWLDAHFSSGITYEGSNLSSIISELLSISKNINKFDQIAVFIDDIDGHFFDPKSYPKIDYYVEWANNKKLKWLIENNIFIAKTKIIGSELVIR